MVFDLLNEQFIESKSTITDLNQVKPYVTDTIYDLQNKDTTIHSNYMLCFTVIN